MVQIIFSKSQEEESSQSTFAFQVKIIFIFSIINWGEGWRIILSNFNNGAQCPAWEIPNWVLILVIVENYMNIFKVKVRVINKNTFKHFPLSVASPLTLDRQFLFYFP